MSSENSLQGQLATLIEKARAWFMAATPVEVMATFELQRKSFVRGETGMGSDAEEARYRAAVVADDKPELMELDKRAIDRMRSACPTSPPAVQSLPSAQPLAVTATPNVAELACTIPMSAIDVDMAGVQFVHPGGMSPVSKPVRMTYTNHRGETSVREFVPLGIGWGANKWHAEAQWMIVGYDTGKCQFRTFALKDCDFTRVG